MSCLGVSGYQRVEEGQTHSPELEHPSSLVFSCPWSVFRNYNCYFCPSSWRPRFSGLCPWTNYTIFFIVLQLINSMFCNCGAFIITAKVVSKPSLLFMLMFRLLQLLINSCSIETSKHCVILKFILVCVDKPTLYIIVQI